MKKEIVVVTGGSGYVGTETVLQLTKLHFRVVIIDIVPPVISDKEVIFIRHDLTKPLSLRKMPGRVKYVIHLAAKVGGIAFANTYPASILRNNLLIDLHSIIFAKEAHVKRFLYVSSSLVYEKDGRIPYREEHKDLQPPALSYGFAKLVGERNCEAFQKEFGLSYTICRLFNIYGVNSFSRTDPHSHVIPDLIRKVLSEEYPLSIYGSGKQARNFTHVKDAANGIVSALLHPKAKNETFNIAGNREVIINYIAQTLWNISGRKEKFLLKHVAEYKNDVERSIADCKKIKTLTEWSPKVSFKKGLSEMVEFYKKNISAITSNHK